MKKDEYKEWTQNPITKEVLKFFLTQIEELEDSAKHAYVPFEPQRTQELFAGLNGARDSWEHASEILTGDHWEYFNEEEENDEE